MKKTIVYGDEGLAPTTCSQVLLIQCKNLKVEKPLSNLEKDNLLKLAKKTGGKAMHVYNNSKHKLVFEELN